MGSGVPAKRGGASRGGTARIGERSHAVDDAGEAGSRTLAASAYALRLRAAIVFTPSQFHAPAGVWRGPLIVLVNGGTSSAAEEVAAELQDNRAAIIMGSPTVGAGCGHTEGGTPTTLKHGGGILELPDCARLRKDGSNEVMGVQPDILIGLRTADGPHRRALRVAASLQKAVAEAVAQKDRR